MSVDKTANLWPKPFHNDQNNERPRLYGRSKGRPLRPRQERLYKELYPKLDVLKHPVKDGCDRLWLEVGFGGAEHLLHMARRNPDAMIIGAEPFINGIARALSGIDRDNLTNIRLYHGDARLVMDALPDASLERLYILFPDPWPKTRHNKRRIINRAFLDDVHRLLKPGGRLFFASDIIDYVDWSLTRLRRHGGFDFCLLTPGSWRQPPVDWPGTRYEQKAHKAGRPCHYFEFIRR